MSLTRKIIKNMGLFAGVQASGILCSIVRAKFIALWIGPVGVGLNALLTNALTMLSQLFQLGIGVSAVRDIAAASDTGHRAKIIAAVLRWSLFLGLAGGLLTLALSPLLSLVTFGGYANSWMFAIIAIAVLASVITAGRQAILQGTERLRRLARLTMTGVIISTVISVPLFVMFRLSSIPWVVLIFAVIPALLFSFDKSGKGQSANISMRESRRIAGSFLRFGTILTISNALTMVSGYVVMVFLNRYASTIEVGIYQAGFTIINNYMGIILVAQTVEYFPRLSAQAGHLRRCSLLVSNQLRLIMFLLVVVVPVFLLCRQLIVWVLFSEDFYAVIPYLTYAIGGGALRIISSTMGCMILARGDSRVYMISELASSFTGMALSIVGYLWGGLAGMGIAYTVWYALYTLAVLLINHYRYGLRLHPRVRVLLVLGVIFIALCIMMA